MPPMKSPTTMKGFSRLKSTATFDTLDKNADSQLSKTEASSDSKLSDNFAALDTNGDGYLSKAEFMAKSTT